MTESNRSGRYEIQPEGYRAFIPASLPPVPAVRVDDDMLSRITRAERALGRLDGAILTLPDPDLFVFMYVRKEAVLSSQIEGTQSSLDDLLAAEAQMFDRELPKDVDEVLNYVHAMNRGLELLKSTPVSTKLIRELHHVLLTGVRGADKSPGEFRQKQNWIGPSGSGPAEATFVPPPPGAVADALADLDRFLRADDRMPVLIKIGLAHAQFETIHPFRDGNGRVGRLLISLLLAERGILHRPVLYLSHYLRRNRQRYYEMLQATRDAGDWESWLRFFFEAMAEAAEEAAVTSRRIVELREQHRATILRHFGRAAGNGLKLLEQLYSRPLVTVNQVRELAGVGFAAANRLVDRFVVNQVLTEVTGHARNRLFRYSPYVQLFNDRLTRGER